MKDKIMNSMVLRDSGQANHRRKFFRSYYITLIYFGMSLFISGCGGMNPSPPLPREAAMSIPNATLAAGDEVKVSFSGAPDLNLKQKIQVNGNLSLPTIGDVHAVGKSISGFQAELTARYQPHFQDPTVVVSLENAAAGVYVSGEVLRPGKIPLDRPITALEAVMECGGFTKLANPRQVIVVRNQANHMVRYPLNLNDALNGEESQPFYLRVYDVIYVRQSVW